MAVNLPIRKQAAECRNAGALYIGWKNTTQLFSRAMRIAGGGVGVLPEDDGAHLGKRRRAKGGEELMRRRTDHGAQPCPGSAVNCSTASR
jgi:hypothetical protein